MFSVLFSQKSPDGRSIDTTVASEELIYCTTDPNPPERGLLNPDPNNPSITSVPLVSVGGINSFVISVKCEPL